MEGFRGLPNATRRYSHFTKLECSPTLHKLIAADWLHFDKCISDHHNVFCILHQSNSALLICLTNESEHFSVISKNGISIRKGSGFYIWRWWGESHSMQKWVCQRKKLTKERGHHQPREVSGDRVHLGHFRLSLHLHQLFFKPHPPSAFFALMVSCVQILHAQWFL